MSVPPIDRMLDLLLKLVAGDDQLPDPDTPLGKITREFFEHNWADCKHGLLARTTRIRVEPGHPVWPALFRFEMDLPYKRKLGPQAPVELQPGPISGLIIYRPDLFSHLDQPAVAVRLDETPGFLHPNYSRAHRLLCLGEIPNGAFPLDALLETHLFPILSYQNRRPSHAADHESAMYFALDPLAMVGLEPVDPLY
jgi:hypothetical protein